MGSYFVVAVCRCKGGDEIATRDDKMLIKEVLSNTGRTSGEA